jgi:hypothetical protein
LPLQVLNCDDMKERAKQLLTPGALAYYDAGAEDRTSINEALECWDRDWRLRPRNFVDVSNVRSGGPARSPAPTTSCQLWSMSCR